MGCINYDPAEVLIAIACLSRSHRVYVGCVAIALMSGTSDIMAFLIADVPGGWSAASTLPADTALTSAATLSPAHNSSAASPARTTHVPSKENASGLTTMMPRVFQTVEMEMAVQNFHAAPSMHARNILRVSI